MVRPATRSSDRILMRLGVGLLVAVLAWFALQIVLGWIMGLVRVALVLLILGIVAWFVLVGPPGTDD